MGMKVTNEAEPATPASGVSRVYVDSTTKALTTKDDAGVVRSAATYTHPNHSGEVTSVADGAQTMATTYISNKTLVTAAVGDHIPIVDLGDGALKKVTAQTIIDLANPMTTQGDTNYGGSSGLPTRLAIGTAAQVLTVNSGATAPEWAAVAAEPAWTSWSTVTIGGGGDLTFTTANARYFIDGKILHAEFDFSQTAAGTGTDPIIITPPGSVTLLDAATCGIVGGLDIGNDNVYSTHAVEAIASSNKFQIRRTAAGTYFRGGTHIGNNGNGYGFSVRAAIA